VRNPAAGGILLVDDDEDFRSFLAGLLESIGYETRELASGAAVMQAVSENPPAAILLDVQLPDLNGYEICRQVRDRYGDAIAIVFISGERTDALDRTGGLLLGADDYLVKPVDAGELVARIRRLVERPGASDNGASPNARLDVLTRREREVLDLLADGLPQEAIASRLVISPKTVATHIQRVLGKLEVRSRAQAVALVLREERDVTGHGGGEPIDLLDERLRRSASS
jgi:DNA-binding NarL/FixJ family response regulator